MACALRPLGLLIALAALSSTASAPFVKGCFHQHAAQPARKCHRGMDGVQKHQEECGTDADTILASIERSGKGYVRDNSSC